MGTPAIFNDLMRDEAGMHAAWLPVANNFALGDYGLVCNGVFDKAGHISEFLNKEDTDFIKVEKGSEIQLAISSTGTKIQRHVGGAAIDGFSNLGDVSAELDLSFDRSHCFFVRASVSMEQISNVSEIAARLAEYENWRSKYQVIRHVYKGRNCTILSSTSPGARISISGSASALADLEAGSTSANLTHASNGKIGILVIGESGVIGLRLFKLRWLRGGVNLLSSELPQSLERRMEIVYDDIVNPLQDDV